MVSEPILRRTALFDAHRALGAKIVPFGGFEMPVQYAGILAEHDAVRNRAGLFDLSHMAQFELRGETSPRGRIRSRLTTSRR
jgi:aminomethyltransferase